MGKAIETGVDNLGYFNPPNVYRPAIIDIRLVGEYDPSDGATNTYRITQNDGKVFEFDVKNGSGGSAGRSVISVEQIQVSTESLGKNITRITLSDGTYTDVEIRNGAQGGPGPQGQRGPAGIDEVEATVDDAIGAPSVETSVVDGKLHLDFHNMKGPQGEPAVAIENYVTVEADEQTTDVTDILPETGSADTLYRVACWDGSQYDDTVYSVYGWYNGAYRFLEKKEVGIDDEPTADSENLVKSGGVAAQISQLGQDITGEFNVTEWFQGNINGETGIFGGKNIRVTNGSAINVQNDVRIVCGGDVKIVTVVRYKDGKSPVEGGTADTDFIVTQVPSASNLDYIAEYDSDFPNLYVSFCRASDATANISTDYVAENVAFYSYGGIYPTLETLEKSTQSNKEYIEAVDVKVDDLQEAYQKGFYYTKSFPLTVQLNPSTNLYPISIKKNSVFYVLVETSNISSLNGLYFKDKNGTSIISKYSLTNGSKITCYASEDIAGLSLYFLTSSFNPGYSSGSVKLNIVIDEEQKYLSIPTTDALQTLELIAKKGDAVKLRFNGDTSKTQKISGVYLYKDSTIISLRYSLALNEWYTFEKLADDINTLKVYTVADQVTAANSITIDIVHGSEMVSEIAYENRDIILSESDKRIIVPDYYFTEQYLSKKIERINKLAQEADGDVFVFTTDEHWGYNAKVSPAIIKYLERYCNFTKIISTGDHVQNINEYQQGNVNKECLDYMFMFDLAASGKPWHSSVGNHAYLSGTVSSDILAEVNVKNWVNYAFYFNHANYNHIVVGDPDRMYYYLDNKVRKLRYIFLSIFVPEEEQVTEQTSRLKARYEIGNEQLDWFENQALNVDSGWGIVIVAHSVVSVNFTNQTTNDQTILISQDASRGIKELVNIILNYNGNGEIIALLSGHVHRDGIDMVDDELAQNDSSHLSGNAFFNLCTTCDAGFFPSTMTHEYIPHRVLGTINECAFDFCILNRSKHRFDMVRIGDKANLVYNYSGDLEERAVVYQIQNVAINGTKALEHDIEGDASWSSSDTSVATVNDGTVTGVAAGFAKITVEDATNHRAIVYIIKVS